MANIKDKIENIRKAVFGKDVRGSLADGLDAVNKETESTTSKQTHLEKTFDQLVINSGTSNAEIVDARVDKNNNNSYAKLGDRLDAHSALMEDIKSRKENATNLLSLSLQKISRNIPVKIVCQGDSLFYGQDENSSDKRPADTTPCDDDSRHGFKRAGKTIPEALQEFLDFTYTGVGHTVINKGYSGDWASASYQRWNKNSNADIAFIMLGSNDSNLTASWVPTQVRGNITEYLNSMRKIIEIYLNWGTIPVLLSSPRTLSQENRLSGRIAEAYRSSLITLSNEYNIPFIDVENLMNGIDNSYYSDDTHLNTKGYTYVGSRLMPFLIGFGLVNNDVKLFASETLGARYTRDNFIINGNCLVTTNPNSFGTQESGSGLLIEVKKGKIIYSFETIEDNLILIPCYSCNNSQKLKFSLDFGLEQGDTVLMQEIDSSTKGYKPPSSFITIANGSNLDIFPSSIKKVYSNNNFIQIANKGFHTVIVEQEEKETEGSFFNGIIAINYKDFINMSNPNLDTKQNTILQKLTHNSYSATPTDVSSVDINISELNETFVGNKVKGSEQYTENIMKITMIEVDKLITEHIFTWHDNGSGNLYGGFYQKSINTINIASTVTNQRTITNVTYDKSNKKYVINFGGNLKALCSLVVTLY